MAYTLKPLPFDPKRIKGMSERLIVSHYENNYAGAVNRLNAIAAQLASLDFAAAPVFVINGLKREELIASNSMILHEVYFASLGEESEPAGALRETLVRDFGSLDRWRAEFSAMGKAQGGGSGWVLLTWQDIRLSPDGKLFYVADMKKDGVFLVDGDSFTKVGFIHTGVGAHGLYPSRDAKLLYVDNRRSHNNFGRTHGPGSVAVIDLATKKLVKVWPIPGGGSPDMGNVTPSGKHLWLSGRWDNVAYRIDTTTGAVVKIPVGLEPHGLCVWPQPGRYSLGHTGNMR
jgi:superoxide dismutase